MSGIFSTLHNDPLSTEIDIESIMQEFKNGIIDYNSGILNDKTRERNFDNAQNTDTYLPVYIDTPVILDMFTSEEKPIE